MLQSTVGNFRSAPVRSSMSPKVSAPRPASFRAPIAHVQRSTRRVAAAAAPPSGNKQGVEKVTAEELEVAIMERETPIIIDFYADWCGPCQLLAKELEKVSVKFGPKVKILKVNTDENTQLATQLQIYGLPTIIFVSPNKEKPSLRTEGLLPAETIIEIIEKELMQ